MKFSMSPVINKDCTTLILGSLPGEKSLQLQEYYAHPQNQFWRIMCAVLNEQMPDSYKLKKQMLLEHNIALWDVVQCAQRDNSSLDSEIKNAVPNDIEGILASYKKINQVLLNGGKSNSLFKKYFSHLDVNSILVPSTSPAYASMHIDEKIKLWNNALFCKKF